MDMERKAQLVNRVSNLSDISPVSDWKALIQLIGDMYKEECAETLSGGTLTTERSNADVDIASLVAEFDADTSKVLKPN
jgi:hypothetical protein